MNIIQHRLILPDREVLVLACEHVCPESVAEIRQILSTEQPNEVCVELDTQRLNWLEDRAAWEKLDLIQVMRRKQLPLLSSHLALRIFHKRLARFTSLEPGDEMWVAVQAARELGANVVLADREILTTGVRAWRKTPFWSRPKLLLALTFGTLQRKRKDKHLHKRNENITERVVDRLERQLPAIKHVLVDERDYYIAHSIHTIAASSKRIVAIVGPANFEGVLACLQNDFGGAAETIEARLAEVSYLPVRSRFANVLPWLVSLALIGLFVAGFMLGDPETMANTAQIWFACHFVLAGLFTIAAYGHFWTVLAVAVTSPFVSLNPLLGAGMVGAMVQVFKTPPSIREIETVGDDIRKLSGWWKNRLARVVLVLLLANIGSTLGTVLSMWLISKYYVSF